MNCSKFHSDLISGKASTDFDQHLSECHSCMEVYDKVNDTMALLDLDEPVPESLAGRVMADVKEMHFPKVRRLTVSNIIQIAAAICFGVFIGHKFGQIANIQPRKAKQDPVSQYYEAHHLQVDPAEFTVQSLISKN